MSTTSMPLHRLGKDGPLVPALGFGLMGMSGHAYGKAASDEERFALLDRAVELGATFWDSADLYADGEELLGKWFGRTGKRDQIFLATKFGFVAGSRTHETNSSAEYCKKCCEESLKRLGVDYIDLFYVHSVNPATPIEETMRALVELKEQGKIKHIGLSSISSRTLERANAIGPVTAVQLAYSVYDLGVEGPAGTDLLATCRRLGCGVVVATPLSRGLLTSAFSGSGAAPDHGDPTDARPHYFPRFSEANRAHNAAVVARLAAVADRKGCTVAQLALAWLLKQGDDIFPIPGTKQVRYLEENCGTLGVRLSEAEEREIRAFVAENEIAGGPVPAGYESFLYRDTKEEGGA